MSGLGLFRLPGFRRSSSSSDEKSQSHPPPPNPSRVKRPLLVPTAHKENLRFVRKEMKKAKNEAAKKWNFDFDAGTPMKGRYNWEEAKPSEVHALYNLERLPHLVTHSGVEWNEAKPSEVHHCKIQRKNSHKGKYLLNKMISMDKLTCEAGL